MSGQLQEIFEKTKKYDKVTPEIIEGLFKFDSDNVEGFGRAIGWDQLEQDARYNQQHPSEGIANASLATGLGFMGAGLSNWLGAGAGGASAAPAAGVVAPGMAGTAALDTALINAGYANLAGGNLTGLAGGGAFMGGGGGKALQALSLVNSMGGQPQPQGMMAPPPQQQQPYEPLPMPYAKNSLQTGMPKDPRLMTEEEKKRLRMQGYRV